MFVDCACMIAGYPGHPELQEDYAVLDLFRRRGLGFFWPGTWENRMTDAPEVTGDTRQVSFDPFRSIAVVSHVSRWL